jgi:hypothetical protein
MAKRCKKPAAARLREGDLAAMDRIVRLTGELDRYHSFARTAPAVAAEAASPGAGRSAGRR